MKVREYLQELIDLTNTMPEVLDMDVIYTSDDEGNDVNYANGPCITGWVPSERCFDSENGQPALCVN